MDRLTFIVEMAKATAWPLLGLVAIAIFRSELRGMLQRIKRGKVGTAEFEFEDRVATLRGRIGDPDPNAAQAASTVVAQAEQDPRSVILNAWLTVQAKVETVVARHGMPEDRKDPRSVSLRVLHRVLRDKPEYVDMYNDLKALRNQAVNDTSFAPRPSSVVEYAALANELSTVLAPYASDA